MTSSAWEMGAPAPLAPLTDEIISPANIEAETRRQRAQPLTGRQQAQLAREAHSLKAALDKAGYAARWQVFAQKRDEYRALRLAWQDTEDETERAELKAQARPIAQQLQAMQRQLAPLVAQSKELAMIAARFEDHRMAIEREKAEKQLQQDMNKEMKVYKTLLIDKLTALGHCYRYERKGEWKVDKVSFSNSVITLDAIYFRIDASRKTALAGYRQMLPQGVQVQKIMSDETCYELSITCGRQVTSYARPDSGAWLIVNRLSAPDGLLSYVSFKDVMSRYPNAHNDRVPVCVGVGVNRSVQWINLGDFHHWLISGYSGSGKSNMLNVMLATLISQQSPDKLRLLLIDLKGGMEFDAYADIPHLLGEMVEDVPPVVEALAGIETILRERQRKFKGVAKSIEEYWARRPSDPMPRIVIVFDEVASIANHGQETKRIIASLGTIARLGRAVGVQIVLCTQHPDVNVIDGQIKNNLVVRITGRMQTSSDSVTALGKGMARDLAALPGRMMLSLGPDPLPVQTPHISQDELATAIAIAKQKPAPAPLELPQSTAIVHQAWTVEKVIALSLKHLDGNISWKRVYEAADDLTHSQARELVEQVWAAGEVEHEGKRYKVTVGRSNVRRLIPVEAG